MNFRGMAKFSLVDYPGKLSCILFTGGCNLRCPYCHNPYLVVYEKTQPKISEREIFDFLESRRRKLDAVVISGGEPTLRGDAVARFAEKVKQMGFLVKLDTNGTFPEKAIDMIDEGLLDMLGVDYKAPAAKYAEVSGVKLTDLHDRVSKLIRHIISKNVPRDIRTTVHKKYLSFDDLKTMRSELYEMGVDEWVLQQFHKTEVIDESLLDESTYTDRELQAFADKLGPSTNVRGI